MFLVSDTAGQRESRTRRFLPGEPAIAALLAVIHFEWTVRRAILALGTTANKSLRVVLKRAHGLDALTDVWREEVSKGAHDRLPAVVKNWSRLRDAYDLRHELVHGVRSCTSPHARVRVEAALLAASQVRTFAKLNGVDLEARLPVRRTARSIDDGPAS